MLLVSSVKHRFQKRKCMMTQFQIIEYRESHSRHVLLLWPKCSHIFLEDICHLIACRNFAIINYSFHNRGATKLRHIKSHFTKG